MDDVKLLERVKRGDHDAFKALLTRYNGMMAYIVRGILTDSKEADRCTPWRGAMSSPLMGQALVTFHLEFFYLQYLLPLLGSGLIYLVLNATPVIQLLAGSRPNWPLSTLVNCVTVSQLFALYGGTRLAFAVTDGPKPKGWLARGLAAYLLSAGIAIWGKLVPLTRPSIFGQSIDHEWIWLYYCRAIVFIALQIYFLVCLFRQSEALAGRGFDITPTPVRYSGRTAG